MGKLPEKQSGLKHITIGAMNHNHRGLNKTGICMLNRQSCPENTAGLI